MLSGNRSIIECVPTCAMTLNGPRYFFHEFFRQPGGMEKLCFYEGMGAGWETWGRGTACISQGLVAGLSCSDLFFQCGVEFIQVDGEFSCLSDANSLSGWTEIFG